MTAHEAVVSSKSEANKPDAPATVAVPYEHYLQSDSWAKVRERSAWKPGDISLATRTVRYFRRRTPAGSVLFIPGFVPVSLEELKELTEKVKKVRGNNICCKLESCTAHNDDLVRMFEQAGWKPARITQYEYTVRIDLRQSVEALRAGMKKRARNELNRATKDGVQVEEVDPTTDNLETMYALLRDTSKRKDFSIRNKTFVMKFWESFRQAGQLKLFFAKHDNDVIAGAIVVTDATGTMAWYKDGASVTSKAAHYGPRLLLWEIAKNLKQGGYTTFDLGGIPNPADYERSRMKGIYIFKTAYTRDVTHMMPAYELPLSSSYKVWPKLELAYRKLYFAMSKLWY